MNELYNSHCMPLSSNVELKEVQEKILKGIELTLREKLLLGRDNTIRQIGNYVLKEDHVYRLVNEETYKKYLQTGYVYGNNENDEYVEYIENGKTYNNNKGVDWYLGGASLKYGTILLECPAYKDYFTPAYDNGCHMSFDPLVRHMKSSGYKKPVPMELIKVIGLKELNDYNRKM